LRFVEEVIYILDPLEKKNILKVKIGVRRGKRPYVKVGKGISKRISKAYVLILSTSNSEEETYKV